MKKTLSLILALTMIVSLFAGLTVTASADYSGTGTFTRATGTLTSGYYVFVYTADSAYKPMSNDTSGNNWILPGAELPLGDSVTDPDASVVWYYDAGTGTINSAGDPTLFVSWPTTGNSAKPTTTATPVNIEDDGDGVYVITVMATPERVLRYNTQNNGWRFYTSNTGSADFTVFKLDDGGETPVHEHDWSGWAPNGDSTHSRTCQAADCPIGTQTEACSFEDRVMTEPSCVDEGELLHTCTVCGYMRSEAIPATGRHADEDGDGFCDVCGEEMPTATVFTLGTELHEGDQVVIYYPAGSLALSVNASGSKLAGTAASIEGEELTVLSDDTATAVLTVEFEDAQNFRLKTAEGKYLTTPAEGNGLSFADEAGDYSLWYLETADASAKTVYIRSTNAAYNGNKNQALEYYKGFTVFGIKTTDIYKFQLFINANPDAHVHEWDEGTVTTEPSCTEKGVMTYSCTGCDETYTEDIPMIPHADGDGDGLCDACEGKLYNQAETLNDGDSLILVTGAFGVAMTGTETSNGGYMASAEVNAQAGVTVPVAADNVWTVKAADEGFCLVNSEGQYLCVNESNKLALGDEDSDNNLWTVGEPVEGLTATGAYLYNPGAEKYLEYSSKYHNYQTWSAPTADYETCYAFTFYTIPVSRFTLSPTEVTLEGFDENGDLLLPFTAETLVLGTVADNEGHLLKADTLHVEFYSDALSNGTDSISFQVYEGNLDEHWGYGDSYGIDFCQQGEEGSVLLFIEPSALSAAAPGVYTGTMRYTSFWEGREADEPVDGPSGTVELTLVIPEPEPLDDGYYLLIAHGDDDWVIGSVDPANKFEPNGNAQDEWLLSTTLAVEDQIKVVRVENNAITGWWPNGEHTQYHVDEAHSGNVTIYFKTDFVDAWREFGGYFYIGSLLKPDSFADVYGCSVSLKGNIGLNFYLIPSEQLLEDDDAYVTLGDKQIKFSEAPSRVVGEDTLYQFSVSLHAKQMNDVVTLQVFDGRGNPVALYRHSNDEDLTETGYSYSVQDYIQKTRETSTDEELIALVNAMADYGILAQRHFDYNTEDLPAVQGDLDSVTAESVADYEKKVTAGTATGVSFAGGSLALKSATAIRLYFSLDEGEIGDYTFKLGTRKVTPTETDLGWMVEIPNIAAKDLDKTYTVKVTRGAGTVLTVQYSALSYAYGVLGGGSKAETLIDLVKGIVLYNRAANAYFG